MKKKTKKFIKFATERQVIVGIDEMGNIYMSNRTVIANPRRVGQLTDIRKS